MTHCPQCGNSYWDQESDLEDRGEVPREAQQMLAEATKVTGPFKHMLSGKVAQRPAFPFTIDPVSMKS